jgi:hypothetical protein
MARQKQTMKITVAGEPLLIDVMTVTIKERSQAMRALKADPDLDPADELTLTAGVVWIVARRSHPELTLDEVLNSLTLGDLADASSTEQDDSPEA